MSDTLTLVTVERRVGGGKGLLVEKVVGITSPNTPMVTEYGFTMASAERERELALAKPVMERIADFYRRFRARESPIQSYNCHAFVTYVLGLTTNFSEWCNNSYQWCGTQTVSCESLLPGEPYGIVQAEQNEHTILGINEPEENLCIYGVRGPMVISNNREIQTAYNGQLVRLLP